MAVLRVTLYAALVTLQCMAVMAREEPKCYSRFDYDEKLLHKLIKLDHKLDLLQDRVDGIENNLNGNTLDVDETRTKLQNDIGHKMGDYVTKISDLEAKVNSIEIDVVTRLKPNVGFHATGVKNMSPVTGETLVFTKVKVNIGTVYNKDTGVFTAPVDGMYLFVTQICNYGGRGLQFHIYVNEVMMTNAIQYDDVSRSTCASSNTVAELHVGDRVFVKSGYLVGASAQVIFENVHRECMFSGVLVN